jgi:hypothetical protein
MNGQQNLGQRWAAWRPSKGGLVGACLAGAVATMVLGFGWGGWVTGGSAQETAQASAVTARYDLAAAICVERFNADGDVAAHLAAFKELKGWNRATFIEEGGWAVMPDRKAEASNQAARLCADQLAALESPVAEAVAQ